MQWFDFCAGIVTGIDTDQLCWAVVDCDWVDETDIVSDTFDVSVATPATPTVTDISMPRLIDSVIDIV